MRRVVGFLVVIAAFTAPGSLLQAGSAPAAPVATAAQLAQGRGP